MQHHSRDMQERTLHIGHVNGYDVAIDSRDVQCLLVVDTLLSERAGQRNDHRAATDTGFHYAEKSPLLHQMLGVMDQHFCHNETHRVRCEELASLFVVQL